MKISIHETYEMMCRQAADDLAKLMASVEKPLLCTASGDTPAGLYKVVVENVQSNMMTISNWSFVGLDEWMGMNGSDEGSCRYYVDRQLFEPLNISGEAICFFDGRTNDADAECEKTEQFIYDHGGIDVAILGLGLNGHIGMNEPGTPLLTWSHVAELAPETKQVGQKYFKKEQPLSQGLTLGIATLMESKHVFLLVNGAHKAPIVKQVLEGEISEDVPGSLLRTHPHLHIYLDAAAASQLKIANA